MSVRALRVLGGTAILLFLVVAFTPAVNLLSFWLMPSRSDTESAEAIVVLGAGGVNPQGALSRTSLHGTIDGVLLYRKGAAPLVVFSGSPDGARDEATVRADLARECGLPPSAILTSSLARTTREEAVRIQSLLSSRGIRKVILVADGPGMFRAVRTFERLGFVVVPQPSSGALELGGGAEDRLNLLRQVAIEFAARAYYRLAGFL
jgi:uncharacterized SAM-binding protein YcdF (DUF218 family)